ncbi:acetyl-CoA carboxylase biotin carboxyl carrier protein subunit [Pedobacter frigoris]|uniref:Acetyl-CoA carboxylase biotin carboxyl carrier protein subunit n=1 Tax=Pedobacter frigoris TaxID=2571272 RepID=A0A4U1CDY0_9SPHI|nr:acetyl-CoA carboxylase biotin carboxyl carrier protein subunit [Pedobacter frigoris]TKC05188.1 acetyl-CoA carboxylase biotin carboxyl carrier protein subunit [Pedobacter frigoris]
MKVKVNEKYNFNVDINNDEITVDDQMLSVDSRKLADGHSHFIYDNKSYRIELVSENKADKTAEVKVNGRIYQVTIEDQYDQLLKQLGLDNSQSSKVKEIKAPMPGLVLNVIVAEEQEVQKGDSLLVLEAMKMENIIKSPTDGIVKKILIKKGDKVEKNEILIQFS